MDDIDRLSASTVKSGPMQAVFKRMLHRSNLLPELHPGFVNDSEVTPEKIAFLKDVLTIQEQDHERTLEATPDKLRQKLGEVSALTELLTGADIDKIVTMHAIDTGSRSHPPREKILKVAGRAAITYSQFMTEQGDIAGESSTESKEAIRDVTIVDETTEHGAEIAFETVLPGFESLHNTIIDLHQSDNLLPYQSNAEKVKLTQSLLLLFEQATSTASATTKKEALTRARKRLRTDIEQSRALNDPKQTDQDIVIGRVFLQQLIQSDGRLGPTTPSYKSMTEVATLARMTVMNLEDGDQARRYVESRIAYTLSTLYAQKS